MAGRAHGPRCWSERALRRTSEDPGTGRTGDPHRPARERTGLVRTARDAPLQAADAFLRNSVLNDSVVRRNLPTRSEKEDVLKHLASVKNLNSRNIPSRNRLDPAGAPPGHLGTRDRGRVWLYQPRLPGNSTTALFYAL